MKRRVVVLLAVAAGALVFTAAAWALRFTDESYFPPVGAVGSPYSFTFGGAGGCGGLQKNFNQFAPYQIRMSMLTGNVGHNCPDTLWRRFKRFPQTLYGY